MIGRQPTAEAVERRLKASGSQQWGAAAQLIAMQRMRLMGFGMVEEIHTGYRKLAGRWVACKKVSGDIRAVAPGGVSVLVEVKFRPDRLAFSDLTGHQVMALTEHHRVGGMSFVCWVHLPGGVLQADLMRWPIAEFQPRSSITHKDVLSRLLAWTP